MAKQSSLGNAFRLCVLASLINLTQSHQEKNKRVESKRELGFCHILFGYPRGLCWSIYWHCGFVKRKENIRKWKVKLPHLYVFHPDIEHMAGREMWICLSSRENRVPRAILACVSAHRLAGGDAEFGCRHPEERFHGMLDRVLKL